jgi:hypothetical protein
MHQILLVSSIQHSANIQTLGQQKNEAVAYGTTNKLGSMGFKYQEFDMEIHIHL